MNNFTLHFVLLFCFSYFSGNSQTFLKTLTITAAYSTSMNPELYSGDVEMDTIRSSSFVVAGSYRRAFGINQNDTLLSDFYLMKNRTDGLTSWIRKFHVNNYYTTVADVGVLHNNDILAIGNMYSLNVAKRWGFMIRTDTNGFVKSFNLYHNGMTKLLVMKDHKIALLSFDTAGFVNLGLMDKNGQLLWNKMLYDTDTTDFYSGSELTEGANKSILITGSRFYDPMYIIFQPYVLSCDSNGNKIKDMVVHSVGSWSHGVNDADKGFYVLTHGYWLNGRHRPSILRVDNQLQVKWQKYYRSNYKHSNFYEAIPYSKNNLNLMTHLNVSNDTIHGAMTFVDSTGIVRRSVIYDKPILPRPAAKVISLPKGKLLFAMTNGTGHSFGNTDTLTTGFCSKDTVTWVSTDTSGVSYNFNTMITCPLSSIAGTVYTYLPKDAHVLYVCGTGPAAPLDTNIITSINRSVEFSSEGRTVKVYPNPANSQVTVNGDFAPDASLTFVLTDAAGRVVKRPLSVIQTLPYSIQIDDLENGLYFLEISDEGGPISISKLLVNH